MATIKDTQKLKSFKKTKDKNDYKHTKLWGVNVTKSIAKASFDAFIEDLPAFGGAFSAIKRAFTEGGGPLADTLKTFREVGRKTKTKVWDDVVLFGAKNAITDLKSGNLYNTQREEEVMMQGMGFESGDMSFDDFGDFGGKEEGDDFGDMGDDFGMEESGNESPSEKTSILSKPISSKKKDLTEENILANNKTKIIMDSIFNQNIISSLGMIYKTTSQSLAFQTSVVQTHYKRAEEYYDKSERLFEAMGETLENVKILLSESNEFAGVYRNSKGGSSYADEKTGIAGKLNDWFEDNFGEGSMGLYAMLRNIAANPFGALMKEAIIPSFKKQKWFKKIKGLDKMVSSISSTLPEYLGKFDSVDNPILSMFGDFFKGLDKTKKFSTSGFGTESLEYEKGAVPFDGSTRNVINKVIPFYLSKILNANESLAKGLGVDLKAGREIIWSDDEGKFKTLEFEIKERESRIKSSIISSYSLDDKYEEKLSEAVKETITKKFGDFSSRDYNNAKNDFIFRLISSNIKLYDYKLSNIEDQKDLFNDLLRYGIIDKDNVYSKEFAKEFISGRVDPRILQASLSNANIESYEMVKEYQRNGSANLVNVVSASNELYKKQNKLYLDSFKTSISKYLEKNDLIKQNTEEEQKSFDQDFIEQMKEKGIEGKSAERLLAELNKLRTKFFGHLKAARNDEKKKKEVIKQYNLEVEEKIGNIANDASTDTLMKIREMYVSENYLSLEDKPIDRVLPKSNIFMSDGEYEGRNVIETENYYLKKQLEGMLDPFMGDDDLIDNLKKTKAGVKVAGMIESIKKSFSKFGKDSDNTPKFQEGGLASNLSTSTDMTEDEKKIAPKEDIKAFLQNGEFVIKKEAVKAWGLDKLNKINNVFDKKKVQNVIDNFKTKAEGTALNLYGKGLKGKEELEKGLENLPENLEKAYIMVSKELEELNFKIEKEGVLQGVKSFISFKFNKLRETVSNKIVGKVKSKLTKWAEPFVFKLGEMSINKDVLTYQDMLVPEIESWLKNTIGEKKYNELLLKAEEKKIEGNVSDIQDYLVKKNKLVKDIKEFGKGLWQTTKNKALYTYLYAKARTGLLSREAFNEIKEKYAHVLMPGDFAKIENAMVESTSLKAFAQLTVKNAVPFRILRGIKDKVSQSFKETRVKFKIKREILKKIKGDSKDSPIEIVKQVKNSFDEEGLRISNDPKQEKKFWIEMNKYAQEKEKEISMKEAFSHMKAFRKTATIFRLDLPITIAGWAAKKADIFILKRKIDMGMITEEDLVRDRALYLDYLNPKDKEDAHQQWLELVRRANHMTLGKAIFGSISKVSKLAKDAVVGTGKFIMKSIYKTGKKIKDKTKMLIFKKMLVRSGMEQDKFEEMVPYLKGSGLDDKDIDNLREDLIKRNQKNKQKSLLGYMFSFITGGSKKEKQRKAIDERMKKAGVYGDSSAIPEKQLSVAEEQLAEIKSLNSTMKEFLGIKSPESKEEDKAKEELAESDPGLVDSIKGFGMDKLKDWGSEKLQGIGGNLLGKIGGKLGIGSLASAGTGAASAAGGGILSSLGAVASAVALPAIIAGAGVAGSIMAYKQTKKGLERSKADFGVTDESRELSFGQKSSSVLSSLTGGLVGAESIYGAGRWIGNLAGGDDHIYRQMYLNYKSGKPGLVTAQIDEWQQAGDMVSVRGFDKFFDEAKAKEARGEDPFEESFSEKLNPLKGYRKLFSAIGGGSISKEEKLEKFKEIKALKDLGEIPKAEQKLNSLVYFNDWGDKAIDEYMKWEKTGSLEESKSFMDKVTGFFTSSGKKELSPEIKDDLRYQFIAIKKLIAEGKTEKAEEELIGIARYHGLDSKIVLNEYETWSKDEKNYMKTSSMLSHMELDTEGNPVWKDGPKNAPEGSVNENLQRLIDEVKEQKKIQEQSLSAQEATANASIVTANKETSVKVVNQISQKSEANISRINRDTTKNPILI
jgi:hypothetical protein